MTPDELKEMRFRGPVRFLDGRKGMAQQDFECIVQPRFGYSWRRENRQDKGRQFYTVDGREVADLDEAAELLSKAAQENSPAEQERRSIDAFMASPKLGGATRALSEAECNVSVGPFGTVRAWLQRADNPWHQGINAYAESQRQAGIEFADYRWIYGSKQGAHEISRLMYLFEADRSEDTGLVCALGTRCRDCAIHKFIVSAMERARENPRFPRDIDDADIDAAKAWTCIGHILSKGVGQIFDGTFVTSYRNREDAADDVARWAPVLGKDE